MNHIHRGVIIAVIFLAGTSLYATNGDVLIGLGAKARGMGGVGIAKSHGAESALINPAMITSIDGVEVSFGGTVFMPDVSYNGGTGYNDSDADINVIPEVSIANKVNDNFYWGVGMWGTAGMGTDYRNAGLASTGGNGTMQMRTNLQLMKFGLPLAYKKNGLSLGITPVLQYGSLDISYNLPLPLPSPGSLNVGTGVSDDFGFGYTLGMAYDFGRIGVDGLKIGAVYASAISMTYDHQLSTATIPFLPFFGSVMGDQLEQPAEIGVGISYSFTEHHTLAFDYKQILWDSTDGYGDFGWQNQNVYMIGYEYVQTGWAIRAGYNYAEQPIDEQNGFSGAGAAMNMFNLLGFPATVESHYTAGGTYLFSDQISMDVAFTYADENKETYNTTSLTAIGMASVASVKHSQTGISFQLNYKF